MSKHQTSALSPRDIACIEYGRKLEYLFLLYYPSRNDPSAYRDEVRKIVRKCREARERIFLSCEKCRYCKDFRGMVNYKEHYACAFHPFIPSDTAITCEHYRERRSHE